ncbi:MAG: NHL repeat-containing protein [bacterium]
MHFQNFKIILVLSVLLLSLFSGCGNKIELPTPPDVRSTTIEQFLPFAWGADALQIDLNAPEDIFTGLDRLLYVADTGNDRVIMLDKAGRVQGISKAIAHPMAIGQDSQLNLLIVNGSNFVFRIDLVDHNHLIAEASIDTVAAAVSSSSFTGVTAFGATGVFYVTDINKNRILKFDETDQTLKPVIFPGTGVGTSNAPTGITSFLIPTGNLTSILNEQGFIFTQVGEVFKLQWLSGGNVLPSFSPIISPSDNVDFFNHFKEDSRDGIIDFMPEDVAVDNSQRIYVIDSKADSVFVFNRNGEFLKDRNEISILSFGGTGSGEKQFRNPKGIAYLDVDDDQVLYVADTGNNRIVRFKLSSDFDQGF